MDHSPFKMSDYVGARVLNDAKKTKLWALSCAVDHFLYGLHTTSDPKEARYADQNPRVVADAKLYLGVFKEWEPFHFTWVERRGDVAYADVPHMLRDAEMELQRLALLQVTQ